MLTFVCRKTVRALVIRGSVMEVTAKSNLAGTEITGVCTDGETLETSKVIWMWSAFWLLIVYISFSPVLKRKPKSFRG